MTDAPKAPRPEPRPQYFLLFLMAGFALLFLGTFGLPFLAVGLTITALGLFIAFVPEAKPVIGWSQRGRRGWAISGPSPVRQEVVLTGTQQCALNFWFREHQSMDYRIDVLDGEDRAVPDFATETDSDVYRHPGTLCWVGDEAGPAGCVYVPETPGGWTVKIRYTMTPTSGKNVRRASLDVRVDPPTADVALPESPVALPEPVVRWGRHDTPDEQLRTRPSAPGGSDASATSG